MRSLVFSDSLSSEQLEQVQSQTRESHPVPSHSQFLFVFKGGLVFKSFSQDCLPQFLGFCAFISVICCDHGSGYWPREIEPV